MSESFNCAILVNSCDKYYEAWHPFFLLLRKYWPNCKFDIYLNTESTICSEPGVKTLCTGHKEWSNRLADAIEQIDSEYILFFLEDYFLQAQVNEKEFKRAEEILQDNKEINAIYFKKITGHDSLSLEYPKFIEMDYSKKYILNFQVGLWRRAKMLELIPRSLSAWQIEDNIVLSKNSGRFLCWAKGKYYDIQEDVFPYHWALSQGFGIAKSNWLWNNRRLLKKEGLAYVKCKELHNMRKIEYILGGFVNRVHQNKGNNK